MKNQKHIRAVLAFLLIASPILACNRLTGTPTITALPPTTKPESTSTARPVESATPADPLAGSSGLNDSLFPEFGNGGYDVQHYTLDITVNDVSTSDLTATTIIAAKATQDLSRFNLDFIGFEISSITINDQPAEFDRAGQELTVTPSTLLQENETFTIKVEYSGSPNNFTSQSLQFQTGWVTFDGGSFVLSEPDGAATFYPVNDHPLDKASFTFRVTVPEPFEVAANGVLTETIDNGATNTFLFEAHEPMASYLATININEFDIETMESEGGIPIRNYYATGLPASVRKPFARQGEMLTYFGELFGPYPFEVYGSLVLDVEVGAALENQTMSIYGLDMIDPNDPAGTEGTVAHEMAHQWFGDSISVADWKYIWLNEGFAMYASGLWIEHTDGRASLDEWIRSIYETVAANRDHFTPPGQATANQLFNGGVYLRGALTLHALRLEVGDEAFFEILRTYHEQYKGSNATTEDFIAIAEKVSGKDLQSLFNKWLYGEEIPPLPK